MSRDVDLIPVKIGDKLEAYSLNYFCHGRVAHVHDDGAADLEYEMPGKYVDNEEGHFIQLGGVEPGEFVTMQCRARPEWLADGTRRFITISPADY